MAEMTHGHGNTASLEHFITLVTGTRAAVFSLQAEAEAESDALADQVSAEVARVQAFNDALTSMTESLTTAQQDAANELGNLAVAASTLAEQRFADLRERLEESRGAFAAGVSGTRENLHGASAELEDEFNAAEDTVSSLEEELAALAAEEEQTFANLNAEVQNQSWEVDYAARDLDHVLESTSAYLLEGLENYLAQSFETLLSHLVDETQPTLVEMLTELGRSFTRSLDDFDSLIQSAAADLIAVTDPALEETMRSAEDKRNDGEIQLNRSVSRSLLPFADDVKRNIEVCEHGQDVVQNLGQMVPQLAAARDVVQQVQELMDVFNPFG
jgi:hypothetical protein